MSFAGKRYWLVGASEGLGLALAQQMHRAGASVILSARNAARLDEVCATMPNATAAPLDVSDSAAVVRVAAELGPIDGMIWLAGVYTPMPADALDPDAFVQMCDVNFTGCARVLGAVLPAMVAQGAGHIVLTGSLSGFRGLPGAMGYQASKAGVMALGECLYADLRGTGIKVQLANPGFIRTRLTDKNTFAMPFLMEPEAAAAHMMELMQGTSFKKSFPTVFSWLFRLSQFLPDWAYYRMFAPK
ncbi:MAG: SDR family NAD(P)-dependent oxidoreductase [Pseudomonadota bacterium]